MSSVIVAWSFGACALLACMPAIPGTERQVPPAMVVVEGVWQAPGPECPLLRTDAGVEWSLHGVPQMAPQAGARVRVEGVVVNYSPCRQSRRTLRVTGLAVLEGLTK